MIKPRKEYIKNENAYAEYDQNLSKYFLGKWSLILKNDYMTVCVIKKLLIKVTSQYSNLVSYLLP